MKLEGEVLIKADPEVVWDFLTREFDDKLIHDHHDGVRLISIVKHSNYVRTIEMDVRLFGLKRNLSGEEEFVVRKPTYWEEKLRIWRKSWWRVKYEPKSRIDIEIYIGFGKGSVIHYTLEPEGSYTRVKLDGELKLGLLDRPLEGRFASLFKWMLVEDKAILERATLGARRARSQETSRAS